MEGPWTFGREFLLPGPTPFECRGRVGQVAAGVKVRVTGEPDNRGNTPVFLLDPLPVPIACKIRREFVMDPRYWFESFDSEEFRRSPDCALVLAKFGIPSESSSPEAE